MVDAMMGGSPAMLPEAEDSVYPAAVLGSLFVEVAMFVFGFAARRQAA